MTQFLHSLFVCLLAAAPAISYAGSYSQNFNTFTTATTALGDGSYLNSSPFNINSAAAVNGGLKLSDASIGGTYGIFRLPNLDPGLEVQAFSVSFDLAISATNPADGFSLNFGAVPLSDTAGPGESGYILPHGLVVRFDTYVNPGQPGRTISVVVDGVVLISVLENAFSNFNIAGVASPVSILWDSSGLDVSYKGVSICTNLNVPGLVPAAGDRFVFGARTGGATETLIIDNLVVSTTPSTPTATAGPVFNEVVVDNTDLEDEWCQTPGWIELYNGTSTAVNLTGWSLSNEAALPAKWTFPASTTIGAYGYLTVFLGNTTPPPTANTLLHTNFVIPNTGGYLGLYDATGTLKDSFTPLPTQVKDVAYGYLGASRVLGYLETPTPASKNRGLQSAQPPIAEEVLWPRTGGLISAPLALSIPPPTTPGAVIRYTTDNTPPNDASPVLNTTAPLTVNSSANLRARVFAPGRLPGPLSSRTFLMMDSSLTNYRGTGAAFHSNLPVVVLDSFGRTLDAENSTAPGARPYRYCYAVVLDRDPLSGNRTRLTPTAPVDFQGRSGLHVRGESSAGMPQRQYAWETWNNLDEDKKVKILGFAEESDWVLYAPATDKSLLRNAVAYSSMYDTNGQGSAMRTKYVEVFFNQDGGTVGYADYRGVYVLVEKIKRGRDRVDIEKLDPCDLTTPAITGGYIFKYDKPSTDPDFFTPRGLGLQLLEPETSVGSAPYNWIDAHVDAFENALYGPNSAHPTLGYRAYIDETSFMDNAWWVEAFKQIDGYRLSTYFTKDRGQKIRSAPLWDYNLSMGNADYLNGWNYRGFYYSDTGINDTQRQFYVGLRQDPGYVQRSWDRYWQLRSSVFSDAALLSRIHGFIQELTDGQPGLNITNGTGTFPNSTPSAEVPAARHHARWQRLGQYDWPNAPGVAGRTKYVSSTDSTDIARDTASPGYDISAPPTMSETAHLRSFMLNRLRWMDDANAAGSKILRPPLMSPPGGAVTTPASVSISPYTGTAPSGFSYATGSIYYTTDGSDPAGATVPGITRNFVLDNNAAQVVIPTSASLGGTDTSARDWKHPDFNTASLPGGAPVWKSGLNGVGYDSNFTGTAVSYYPHINILMAASVPSGATPVPAEVYGSAMQNVNGSCYIRLPFSLTTADIEGLVRLRLYAKVDDGFIAYVNGVQIAASNAPSPPAWNSLATALQPNSDNDAIIYREFAISSTDSTSAIAALRPGVNMLAIHGLNGTAINSSDLLHRYKLDGETASGPSAGATAQLYTGSINLSANTTIKARLLDSASQTWTPLTEATYVVNTVPASATNLVISKLYYQPKPALPAEIAAWQAATGQANVVPPSSAFEYIELLNIGTSAINLTGLEFVDGVQWSLNASVGNAAQRTLQAGARALIVGDLAAFAARFGSPAGIAILGTFSGNLSDGGERLLLQAPDGPDPDTQPDILRDFSYDDTAPWPVEPDLFDYALILNSPHSNPNHALAINWRASAQTGGSPGTLGYTPFTGSPSADLDFDGLSAFIEYATGSDFSAAGNSSRHLPQLEIPTDPSEPLFLTYRRGRNADGFALVCEWSQNLVNWSPLSNQFDLESQLANPDGTSTLTWRSQGSVASLGSRIFFRLTAAAN